jgi:endo-1,4-beta-xylanase
MKLKSVIKVIILLMIIIVIFAGCSTPQESKSSGGNDSQKSQSANSPSLDGLSYDWINISVDSSSSDSVTGTHDGIFYSFWKDKEDKGDGRGANVGTASMWVWAGTPGHGAWAFGNNIHGLVGGRGWSSGVTNLSITFHGWQAFYADQDGVDDDGYFGVYGWADNNWDQYKTPERLIEYYVVEQHGTKPHGLNYDGGQGTQGSTSSIDSSYYTAWKTRRVNKPSIKGNTDFDQYWSVRADQRQSGTMTFSKHVTLWKNSGWTQLTNSMMNKSLTYQILFVEAPFDANTGSGNGFAYIDSSNR